MNMSTGDAILPDPMNTAELLARLARLMRGCGQKMSRVAFVRAFPRRHQHLAVANQIPETEDLAIDTSTLPRTLKQLYKRYPEIKAPGFPKGYPLNRGISERQDWCREQALKIEKDRQAGLLAEAEMGMTEDTDASAETKTSNPERAVQPAGPAGTEDP